MCPAASTTRDFFDSCAQSSAGSQRHVRGADSMYLLETRGVRQQTREIFLRSTRGGSDELDERKKEQTYEPQSKEMRNHRKQPPLQKPNHGRPQHACSCRDNLLQRTLGTLAPSPCALTPPTLVREYLFSATRVSQDAVSSGCQPGTWESAPLSLGRFSGRRPSARSTIAR